MTTSFLSPMVDITETDNTLGVASVGTSTGGMVIGAAWGEVETPTLCATEADLVNYFGKPNDKNFKSWYTASNFLAYTSSLYVVRANAKGLKSANSTGADFVVLSDTDYSEKTDDEESNALADVGQFIARCPGSLGNSLMVTYADAGSFNSDWVVNYSYVDDNGETHTGTVDCYHQFAYAPSTSPYVAERNGSFDELHLLVIDIGGEFTGTRGAILEKYENLSKAVDSCGLDGDSNYYKYVLNTKSEYVYFANLPEDTEQEDDEGNPLDPIPTDFGHKCADFTFRKMDKFYYGALFGGADDYNLTIGNVLSAYDTMNNAEQYDISLFMTGAFHPVVGKYVIQNICEVRKDCMGFVSPVTVTNATALDEEIAERTRILGTVASDDAALTGSERTAQQRLRSRTVYYRNNFMNISSSYGVLDSGWKYQYDKFNDCYRWVPLNGDIAGLYARTSDDAAPWWSAAGYNRGQIKNCVKLSYSPSKPDRDILYPLNINPVVTFTGEGTVLYGDKTMLTRSSAFQQTAVRRLFIYCEKILANAAKHLLFELNDDITRATAKSLCETPLRVVQGSRGIVNFKVVCDRTNNTDDIINANRLVVDLYIQPNRSINYVSLNFIAEASGSSVFSESEG